MQYFLYPHVNYIKRSSFSNVCFVISSFRVEFTAPVTAITTEIFMFLS